MLIHLAPFGFVAELFGSVEVKWGSRTLLGVYLEAVLSGPQPLEVHGKATIKLWLFSKTVRFAHTLGTSAPPPPLPAAQPLDDLVQALRDTRNWRAQLPEGGTMLVTLRSLVPPARMVLAHPLGSLSVTQNVLPLNVPLERYGGGVPAGERQFAIAVQLGEDAAPSQRPVQDWFAPGQFLELSDAQRLAQPSFARFDAGVQLGGTPVAYGEQEEWMATAPLAYESTVIDAMGQAVAAPPYTPEAASLSATVALGAVARRSGAHAGRARYRGPRGGVLVAEPATAER